MFEFMTHLSNGKNINRSSQIAIESDPYEYYLSGFWKVEKSDISLVESELGYTLSDQLSSFYLELGVGTIRKNGKPEHISYNNVICPWDIPRLIAGNCAWMDPEMEVQNGVLPFFERDVGLFLCLHPRSENPNAVYWMWGDKICDSLIEFFQHLVVDPDWFNPSKGRISQH